MSSEAGRDVRVADDILELAEECIDPQELRELLQTKSTPVCYDGFEPSNNLHVAQGILKVLNFNKMVAAGIKCKIWIADYFAQLNGKLGGDLASIKLAGYNMIAVWKALGMDPEVEFLFASETIEQGGSAYWELVMDVARRNNLKRVVRCSQIMGRAESDDLTAAQIMYAVMQCSDVFFLDADIVQMGMDQRKVNVMVREYADQTDRKKPVILSHEMLPGLLQGQGKMSKSNPDSAVFMNDEPEVVRRKIIKAYCPPGVEIDNPCLAYVRCLIMPWFSVLTVDRPSKYGGVKIYDSYKEVSEDFVSGRLHPADLKEALVDSLNRILEPVRRLRKPVTSR